MKKALRLLAAASVTAALALPSAASAQDWANWTSGDVGAGSMAGTIGSSTITYSGSFNGYQLSDGTTRTGSVGASGNCGYDFFCLTAPYTSAGVNAPSNHGFVQYTGIGRGTVTFGEAVTNPLIAFISVGQPNLPVRYNFFGNSFTVLSNNNVNPAAWGVGGYSESGNVLTGFEYSGTIRLNGTFTSFDMEIMDAEAWHGFTVGAERVGVVPEPSTYALMGAGLLAVGFAARRRRKV